MAAHALDGLDVDDDGRLARFRRTGFADLRDGVDLDDVELQGVREDGAQDLEGLVRSLRAQALGQHVAGS